MVATRSGKRSPSPAIYFNRAPSARRGKRTDAPVGHERRDLLWLLALVAVLLGFFLWPTFAYRWPFGVGPDEPVYLWWARVGAAEGISLVGARPGTPALIPTVAGALHMAVRELMPRHRSPERIDEFIATLKAFASRGATRRRRRTSGLALNREVRAADRSGSAS